MDAPHPSRHLLEYWAVLRRRRWVVALGTAVVAVVALVGSFLVTPLYRATASIQIERYNPEILNFKDISSVDYSFAAYQDFYQTQYKILVSDAVARRTVERAGLLNHPEFEAGRPGLRGRLRAMFPASGPRVERRPEDLAAARVQGALEISPVRNSHLVMVSWISADPLLAAKVANAVAESYIAFNIDSSFTATDQANEFLADQVAQLKKEIDELERLLQSYGEAKRIVAVDDANNITLRALSDIAKRRTEAQTLLAAKEAANRSAQTTPAEALPETLDSPVISRIKQEQAALEAELSEKEKIFREEWPGMVQLRSKLEQVNGRLAAETESVARSVRLAAQAEYLRARDEVENLDRLLARQEEAAQTLRRDAVEFVSLQSDVQKKRETLNALIKRQNEMALSTRLKDLDVTSSNVKIVDRARPPSAPFRPNKTLNLTLGLLLGATLGVATAFFLEYLDNSVGTAAEIERVAHLPTLAIIPRLAASPLPERSRGARRSTAASGSIDLVAHLDRRAAISEAYRELRTAILLSNAGRPPRRLMVTSALPEEGKSATAMNLSIVLAQMGRRVLLVDADLRRPRVHTAFGLENARGMSTYLSGLEDDPRPLLRPSGIDGLQIVTSGPIPPDPSELLNGARFAAFHEVFLENGFDHLVFDSPPVLSVADPVIVGSRSDAVVLVVRAHRTARESLRLAVEKFAQAGIKPIGAVLNDVDVEGRDAHRYRYYGRVYGDDRADGSPAPAPATRAG